MNSYVCLQKHTHKKNTEAAKQVSKPICDVRVCIKLNAQINHSIDQNRIHLCCYSHTHLNEFLNSPFCPLNLFMSKNNS